MTALGAKLGARFQASVRRFIGTTTDATAYKALIEQMTRAYEERAVKVTFRNLAPEQEVRPLRAQGACQGNSQAIAPRWTAQKGSGRSAKPGLLPQPPRPGLLPRRRGRSPLMPLMAGKPWPDCRPTRTSLRGARPPFFLDVSTRVVDRLAFWEAHGYLPLAQQQAVEVVMRTTSVSPATSAARKNLPLVPA